MDAFVAGRYGLMTFLIPRMTTLFGLIGLLVWVVAPIVVSMKIFERQNL